MPRILEVFGIFCARADRVFKNSQSHRTAPEQAISQSRMGSCFTVSLKLLHSIAMAAKRLSIKDEPVQLTEPTKNLNLDQDPDLSHVPKCEAERMLDN